MYKNIFKWEIRNLKVRILTYLLRDIHITITVVTFTDFELNDFKT